jgi:hypothetical protein
MAIDPQLIKGRLEAAAQQAPKVELTAQSIRQLVARRRRRRLTAVTLTASVAVVSTGAATWMAAASPGPPQDQSATGRWVWRGMNPVAGGPSLRCGDVPPKRLISSGLKGQSLKIRRIQRMADGSPQVTVDFVTPQPAEVQVPLGVTYPRLVVLRDGRVVAGQDTPARPGYRVLSPEGGNFPAGWDITPSHPLRITIPTASTTPCGSLTWPKLWEAKGRYRVLVLAASQHRWWDGTSRGWSSEDYLVARAQFTEQ